MNTQNASNTQTDLSRVLAKITEIANASATGNYIYRNGSVEDFEAKQGVEVPEDIAALLRGD